MAATRYLPAICVSRRRSPPSVCRGRRPGAAALLLGAAAPPQRAASVARARRFAQFMHAAAPRAPRRAGTASSRTISSECWQPEVLARRRSVPLQRRRRAAEARRAVSAQPHAGGELRDVPARRSAGEDRSLHDGEFARGAIAVSRRGVGRVRRRSARSRGSCDGAERK